MFSFYRKSPVLLVLFLFLISAAGCQSVLFTMAYLIKGNEAPAEYDILKKGEIKVVVVCRSRAMNQLQGERVPRDLTKKVSKLIESNVKNKKLKVVDYRKVEDWLDDSAYSFEEFEEVGAAFKADYVIGIELLGYQTQENSSTMQGRASWVVKTYDINKDELIAEKPMRLVYPPEVPISITDRSSLNMFQVKFVDLIARQIAALYHPHDPNKIIPIDADLLELH